MQAHKNSRKQ